MSRRREADCGPSLSRYQTKPEPMRGCSGQSKGKSLQGPTVAQFTVAILHLWGREKHPPNRVVAVSDNWKCSQIAFDLSHPRGLRPNGTRVNGTVKMAADERRRWKGR